MGVPLQNRIYEFADFRLDAAHLLLYQNGRQLPLTPKVVETLLALVERAGEVVSKDELMEIVWAESFVEESNLSQNLYILRKALSKMTDGSPFIETLKRRGYRFNAPVSCSQSKSPSNPTESNVSISVSEHHQTIGFLTPIIGREKEVSDIKHLLLRDDVRLVTLAGVGGTGKTKLAQIIAHEVFKEFADGVYFIELSAVTNPDLVVSTIAQHFGINETGGKPVLQNLSDRLIDKEILLIVDNFEQVISAAPIFTKLLAETLKVKFLITSRMVLNLSSEWEYLVPPLSLPTETSGTSFDELSNYEAVKFFAECARNYKPHFSLTKENVSAVASICVQLDGLPLAIELAAARIKIISPGVILDKLKNSLNILTGGANDLPLRQQTMRGAIKWSYELLSEEERRLFRYFSVFKGGFTFEAAEAVCTDVELYDDPDARIEILDIVTSLIDKSLLIVSSQTGDDQRFHMLEVVREFAHECLEQNAESNALRDNHASYFAALGEEAEPHLNTEMAGEWLERLECEHNNLRSAIAWLFEKESNMAAGLVSAVRIYLINRGHLTEGQEWLTKALKQPQLSANLQFKLSNGLGFLRIYKGDYLAAQKVFKKDLEEGRATGDKKRIAESLRGMGTIAYSQGDLVSARKFLEEGLEINRELDYKFGIAASLNGLGSLALDEGKTQIALEFFEESLTHFRLLRNENGICYSLLNLGAATYIIGDYSAVQEYYTETITLAQNLGYTDRVSLCLDGFAALALQREDWELSAKLSGAAENLREQIGYELEPIDRQRRDDCISELKASIDAVSFSNFFAQGRNLKQAEAVDLCF